MFRMLAVLALLVAPLAASAAPTCPTDAHRTELRAFRDKLANAESPEKAKKMALSKLELGQKAIDKATKVMPDADGIASAEARLDALEDAVRAADTQVEVAAAFDLDQQALNCDYDTFEIVIIVIGFVLGVIPGIVFLFLFC